ncbi:peroxidase family protein [Polynucleobacter kasalickyi]|uniref:Ca2+-binding protein, RTX toxin-related n=1 Tax=Polynucleobacter kasalickyi TaxID=1938817 RepID=A0A1W1Y4P3_9BURK|nr:peroxidase family protein [Polynucleobacter kasalickyi]SMC31109.1 Ca2+-binding protein, RTX toxin-related [Polynucleobacter kasalickyi]
MAGSTTYALRPWSFNTGDMSFLYSQATFIPLFDSLGNPIINWDGTTSAYLSNGTLIPGTTRVDAAGNNLNVNQYGVSYVSVTDISGLRNLTGQNNNLTAGQTHWGQVNLPFPRIVAADFGNYLKPADPTTGVGGPTLTDVGGAQVQAVDSYGYAMTDALGNPILTAGTGAFTLTGGLNQNLTPIATANSGSAFDVAAAAQANSATYIDSGAFFAKQFDYTKVTFATDYLTTGSGGYSSNGSQGQATTTPLSVTQASVVDYTPRMISLDTTTAGVTFAKDANGKIVFNEGVAQVTDWGQLDATTGLGQVDYQNLSGNTVVTNHNLTVFKHVLQGGTWVATKTPFTITNTQAALHFADGSVVIDPVTHNPIVIDGSNLLMVDPVTGAVTPTAFTNGAAAHYSNGVAITDPTALNPQTFQPTNAPITLSAIAAHQEQFIGGINPGVAPNNGYFALFGQFFDHGLDFIGKGAQQTTVKIALATSDPLYIAPGNPLDGFGGQGNTSMTINRANVAGFDTTGPTAGDPNYVNHSSPYIDQSQTYGSDNSKISILREWVSSDGGKTFHAGASLLDGHTAQTWTDGLGQVTDSTLPTLNELRAHLVATGRDDLNWDDISGLRNRDASGHVITGAGAGTGDAIILDMNPHFDATHFATWTTKPPVLATLTGAAAGVATATNIIQAINAQAIADKLAFAAGGGVYSASNPVGTISMGNIMIGAGPGMASLSDIIDFATFQPKAGLSSAMTALVKELLIESIGDHYVAGDGRANENVGLTSIHHVWHEEHNYQVAVIEQSIQDQDTQAVINGDTSHDTLHKWQIATAFKDANGNYLESANGAINWDSEKIFNAAKITVEMEYQHVAVDQYSRSVTPDIPEFVGYNSSLNANVTNEYGQVAFRFGHSTLRETIDTMDPTGGLSGKIMSYALKDAFLNPALYSEVGAGAITLGMTHQQMNEVDEFLTPAMNQGLLGQPLDLAAINIARGRDMGLPTLNDMRVAIGKAAYQNWSDFGSHMLHSSNLAGFIAAYSMDGDIDRANALIDVYNGGVDSVYGYTYQSANDFMTNNHDVNQVDAWLGGLAEQHVLGGLLGETFNYIFLDQIERLMDGDRFYYLYRLSGLQINEQMVNEQFKDIVERNTGLTHLNGNVFAYADAYYDMGQQASSSNIVVQGREHKYADVMATYEAANTTAPQQHVGIYSVGSSSTGGVNAELGNGVIKSITTVIHNDGAQNLTVSDVNNQLAGAVLSTISEKYVYDVRPDVMHGQAALDGMPVSGDGSNEVLVGTNYDDVVFMGEGDDTAYGDGGNDIIYGGGGMDKLYGGAGNDTMYGGEGPDVIDGGAGDDVIFGDASGTAMNGTDQLIGGFGNDTIYGGIGIDKISGEAGDDVIYGGADTDPFTHAGDGNDYIDGGTSGDLLWGDAGDDVIVGGADQDVLSGGSGDDILRPGAPSQALVGAGVDEVVGGLGITTETAADIGFNIMDLSDWGAGAPGVVADFSTQAAPAVSIKGTATDFPAWFQIQGIVATANNDTIIGDDVGNWLIGGSGNDTISGGGGNDIIVGNHVRLDSLIGNYQVGGVQATYDYTAFDTATHRAGTGVYGQGGVAATLATTGDLIDQANAVAGSHLFDKHFTDMLKSAMFKDTVLGNDMVNSNGTGLGADTAVYTGRFQDYNFKGVLVNTSHEGSLLGILISDKIASVGGQQVDVVVENGGTAGGSDLLVGMTYIQFSDQRVLVSELLGPRFTNVVASTSINENSTATIETFGVSLASGNPLSVRLGNSADDANFTLVNNGNGTYSLKANGTGLNYENLTHFGTTPYNVDIIATDTVSGAYNVTNIAVSAINVNEAATGSIALTGAYTASTAAVGSSVAVTVNALNALLDPDLVRAGATTGLVVDQPLSRANPQPVNTSNPYQWQSSTNGTTWTNVNLQTNPALSVNSGNAVTQYRTTTSYTDVFGTHNSTNDTKTVSGVTILGTNNAVIDNITGSANADIILGFAGNDVINGFQGADTVDGGVGTDRLNLGLLNGAYTTDLSNATDAQLTGIEQIYSSTGIAGVAQFNLDLSKQSENLLIDTTGNGGTFIVQIGGVDKITVGTGVETISTGRANDTIVGFAAGDTVDGGTQTDTIEINSARDALAISAAVNAAVVNVEVISAANAAAGVTIDLTNQTESFTSINGSAFADMITGATSTTNKIYAGAGNDTINGYSNAATVDGGAGTDTIKVFTTTDASNVSNATAARLLNIEVLDFSSVNAGVTVRMANMANSTTLKYVGSGFADTLAAHNTATTNTGDTLVGGAGNDSLAGGTGHDTFAFETTAAGNGLDTITGFTKTGAAFDTLQVSSFLTNLNATNVFSNGSSTANVAASAYDQHVVLINSTVDLSNSANWSGIFGNGAGHLGAFTNDTQKAVLIEGTTGNNTGTDKMYYVSYSGGAMHVDQVASLVGVGQFTAGTDVHVA